MLFFLDVVVDVFQLRLEAQHFGEIWTVLRQSVSVIRRRFAFLLEQIGQSRITLDLRHGIQVPCLSELIEGLLPHALRLGVGELLVDIAQPLRGHVLLVVERPYLVLAFVGNARVFRLLYFDFEIAELVGEPVRSLRRGFILAAVILFHVSGDVRIHRASGKARVRGLETHVHQAAVGDTLHTKVAQEFGEFGRASLVRKIATGDGL